MESTVQARSEQVEMPINYFWSVTDESLPFAGSAFGNPFIFPPPSATRTAPPSNYPKGTFPCWDNTAQEWVIKQDYRQIALWDKKTGQSVVSQTVELQDGLTDVAPNSKYDVWNEETQSWVKDQEKEDSEKVAERIRYRSAEVAVATDQIDQLNDIVEYVDGEEGDEYKALLKAWRLYRTKLNVMKINDLSVKFPDRPKMIGE